MAPQDSPSRNSTKPNAGRALGGKRRLKHRKEFLRIQEHGKKEHSRNFLLIHSDIADSPRQTGESRIGVTITRKVDKRAVRRNKLRRRVKEVFRHLQRNLQQQRDVVIIAKRSAMDLSYAEIRSEIAYLLRRAKLIPLKHRRPRPDAGRAASKKAQTNEP